MKNFIFSLLACLMVFAGQQNATAQNNSKPVNEAAELFKAAQESKAELETTLQKGIVLHDLSKKKNQIAATKSYGDAVESLRDLQNITRRIEKAGPNMPAKKLEAFKKELAQQRQKFDQIVITPEASAVAGTNDSLATCRANCKKTFPGYWTYWLYCFCTTACWYAN